MPRCRGQAGGWLVLLTHNMVKGLRSWLFRPLALFDSGARLVAAEKPGVPADRNHPIQTITGA